MVFVQRCCRAAVLVLQVSAHLVEELKKDSMETGLVQLKTQDNRPDEEVQCDRKKAPFENFSSNVHGCPQELPNVCGKRGDLCEVLVDVPEQCAGTKGANCAAVFAFHGAGSTAESVAVGRIGSLMRHRKLKMFGVFPQGGTLHWNTGGDVEDEDEGAFLTDIFAALRAMGWTGRAYAHGTSNGAALVQLLAVNNPVGFAGAAPASTQLTKEPSSLKMPKGWLTHPNPSTKPLPMMLFHGTSDKIAQYHGGTFKFNSSIVLYQVDESNRRWAMTNGCSGLGPKQTKTFEQHDHTLHEYQWSCPDSSPLIFYLVENGEHTAFLDLECQHLMLDFFKSIEKTYGASSD